jgi:2'-5' RNA ligase
MSRPSRTFIAVTIPDDRAEKLQRLQTLIAPSLSGARWVEPDKFHVTLAFLGDVPDDVLNPLCRAVAESVKDLPPFTLAIEKLGVFPSPVRPRVVWAGLTGEGIDTLLEARRLVVEAAASVEYPPEDDRFSPHITIGRLKPKRGEDGDCSPLLRHYERWMGGSFFVNQIVTLASTLTPEGPAYMPLGRAPLRGR